MSKMYGAHPVRKFSKHEKDSFFGGLQGPHVHRTNQQEYASKRGQDCLERNEIQKELSEYLKKKGHQFLSGGHFRGKSENF